MASTIALQDVVSWALTLTKMIPIIGVGGFGQEPALSICNSVISEIMQEPYNWKWNSTIAPAFQTDNVNFTQDYPQNITDLAWFESCTRTNPLSTQLPNPIFEMDVVRTLQPTSEVADPLKISFQYETDSGCTFRVWPLPYPQQPWTILPVYQKKAPVKTSLSNFWDPLPDELAYVYRKGFLAMAYRHADDPRADKEYAEFQMMIKKAAGYSDMEADAEGFYPDWGLFLG